MIPAIGYMIAAYIITRMIELLCPPQSVLPKIFAIPTILVALLSGASLLLTEVRSQSSSASSPSEHTVARPTALNPRSPLIGLTKDQVWAQIGKPSSEFADGTIWVYEAGRGDTQVYFENGRVEKVLEPR